MRNTLTFLSTLFLLLLVGKIGHIGTLGALSWWWLALVLGADFAIDWLSITNRYYDIVGRLILWGKMQTIKKMTRDHAKKIKEDIK